MKFGTVAEWTSINYLTYLLRQMNGGDTVLMLYVSVV